MGQYGVTCDGDWVTRMTNIANTGNLSGVVTTLSDSAVVSDGVLTAGSETTHSADTSSTGGPLVRASLAKFRLQIREIKD